MHTLEGEDIIVDDKEKIKKVKEQLGSQFNYMPTSSRSWMGYASLKSAILSYTDVKQALSRIRKQTFNANLGQYISQIIISKGFSNKEVIDKACFDKDYFYQVMNGRRKHPGRDKILKLCFGLELGVEESNTLLKKAGHNELYARDERDVIIMICLNNSYSLDITDEILLELQHDTLKPKGTDSNTK